MTSFGRKNPGHGYGGPRYPGTFLLALQEALTRLKWQAILWKGNTVECQDRMGHVQYVGLENLFRRLRYEPRERWTVLLADLLASVPPEAGIPPGDLEEVADRLLVRLGPPFKQDDPETDIWYHPLVANHVVATLVIDHPSSMSYVTEKMIADSKQSGPQWLEQALANLRAKSSVEGLQPVHPETGLLQAQYGDAYDSSRALLLHELLPGHEKHGFFVIAPGRDHLLVLPITALTLKLIPWLRAISSKTYQEMPYPISPELFWIRSAQWHHFPVEVDGDEVLFNPPPEFAEVLHALQTSLGDEIKD